MNKPTTTALYSLLVMFVFFGISVTIQSCGGKKVKEDTAEDLADKAEGRADSYSEDEFFEDDGEFSEGVIEEDKIDTIEDLEETETTSSYSNTAQTSSYSTSSTNSAKPYLIVAGNYLLEDNADEMVKELMRKGYQDAEKAVFDLSQYYTVVAGRYITRTAASGASGELKRAGIDNYVIKKK